MKKLIIMTMMLLGLVSCNKEKRLIKNVNKHACEVPGITREQNGTTIYIGNIMTPNGDGSNDSFMIVTDGVLTLVNMEIINDDNITVYEGEGPWDGETGLDAIEGIYKYEVNYTVNGYSYYDRGEITVLVGHEYSIENCEACMTMDGTPIIDDATIQCK